MSDAQASAVLACDDRGTPNPSSGSGTFVLGGFASARKDHAELVRAWRSIKSQLCGSDEVELKWSHFFPGRHQDPSSNPLISSNSTEWRNQAIWALKELFKGSSAFPISTVVPKIRTGASLLGKSPKGKDILDIGLIFAATIGQFALYLKENREQSGEIWFDKFGSRIDEERFQESLDRFFAGLSDAIIPAENIELVRRINPAVRFMDSETEPIIQLADFVSGVIWASAEGDSWFLSKLLDSYAPGRTRTYGITVLEA